MMKSLEIPAKAKINLSLDIVGRRENGYHNLSMLMQSVELSDTVRLAISDVIRVKTNLYYLPCDEHNIAYKAAQAFFHYTGIHGGCEVTIFKRIPVSAGLAGGSADGAAVLRGLNRLYRTHLSGEELGKIGLSCGSDIPFCLVGGTALVTGIGESITPLESLPPCRILLCKPGFGVSTEAAFKAFDREPGLFSRPDTEELLACLQAGNLGKLAANMCNVFEQTMSNKSAVEEIKNRMLRLGALGASMSGSGPTVFGIFTDDEKAEEARTELKSRYRDVWLVRPAPAFNRR